MTPLWAALQALWILLALVGVGFLVQSDVSGYLSIFGARPDLLLGGLVIVARRTGPIVGSLAQWTLPRSRNRTIRRTTNSTNTLHD